MTAEAQYLTEQQPEPVPAGDRTARSGRRGSLVWQKDISGTPQSFEALTQFHWNPEYWFFTK